MTLDLSRLGGWSALPFFKDTLPGIEAALADDPRDIYPPRAQVLAALERTPPEAVKVVILGQDPYPQAGKANGLAFSINTDFPPRRHRDSLDNIFYELAEDLGQTRQTTDLGDWADQGVLLLNALALTVPQNAAGGHRTLGWKALTAQVLGLLQDRPRAYLLWGGDAHKAGRDLTHPDNFVLRTSHPSPMGVHKVGTDFEAFRGAQPFSRTNAWLQAQNLRPIQWADTESPT